MNIKVFEELVEAAKSVARLGFLADKKAHDFWCTIEHAEAELKKKEEVKAEKVMAVDINWQTVDIPDGYSYAQIELDSQKKHRITVEILEDK